MNPSITGVRPGPSRPAQQTVGGAPVPDWHRPGSLDLLRVSLAAFIVITISNIHLYVAPLRVMRPGLVLWLLVVGSVLLMPQWVRWTNISRSPAAKALIAVAALGAAGVPFALSMGQAGDFYLNAYLRVALFFVCLVVAFRSAQDLFLLIFAFVLSGGILAVLSATVMELEGSSGVMRLASSSMYDANDLGVLFVSILPLAILAYEASRGALRAVAGASLLLMPVAMALTGSRGGFVGLMAIAPLLFLTMNHVPVIKRVVVLGLVGASLTLAAPEGYWERMGTLMNPTEDYNYDADNGRRAVAQRGMGYMLQHPITGVGVGNFGRAEGTLRRTMDTGVGWAWLAPHNTYVQVGAEMGIPTLLLWLYLVGVGSVGLTRARRRLPREWRRGTFDQRVLYGAARYLPVSFVGFAVTSFFTSHAYTPPFYILVAFLAATLLLARQQQGGTNGATGSRLRGGYRGVPRRGSYGAVGPVPGPGVGAVPALEEVVRLAKGEVPSPGRSQA